MSDTVLGVLLGGSIGIVTTIINVYFNHYVVSRKENTQLLRDKIEELYQLTFSLSHWNDKARFEVLATWERIIHPKESAPKEPNWDDHCPIERMRMIVDLYFPEFKSQIIKLEDIENTFRNGFYEFLSSTTGSERDIHSQSELIQGPLDEMNSLINDFQKTIAKRK